MARISGISGTLTATIDHAAAGLWNPHATKHIWVSEIHIVQSLATAIVWHPILVRTSARGTAGSSVTSLIQHDDGHDNAPQSGAILDLGAYSVQPGIVGTTTARFLQSWTLSAAQGAGVIWTFPGRGLRVPALAGIAVISGVAAAVTGQRFTFVWAE
jgi:hypothetical protein